MTRPRGNGRLRAANAVLSAVMMALFLIHGVGNSFQMIGVGTPLSKALSHTLLMTCAIHAAIGVVLTVRTLRAQREAGVSYPARNVRFWLVRVSGLAIAVFVVAHVLVFLRPHQDVIRLAPFQATQLSLSLALVVSMAAHVLANMEPLMVSLGVPMPGERAADLMLVLVALLALMGVAFCIYYLRWSVI